MKLIEILYGRKSVNKQNNVLFYSLFTTQYKCKSKQTVVNYRCLEKSLSDEQFESGRRLNKIHLMDKQLKKCKLEVPKQKQKYLIKK
jgi:hypothetical protein